MSTVTIAPPPHMPEACQPLAVPQLVAAFSGDFVIDEVAVRAAFQPPSPFYAIDREYLQRWAADLGVQSTLTLIFEGKLKSKST